MNRGCLLLAAFVACSGATQEAHAKGRVPIVVFWGSGEKITEMGDLPSKVSRATNEELGTQVTVGFLYESVQLFSLDLWTWNGRHVLYAGDSYWELESMTWRQMIGTDPSSEYGKPIFYRIPPLAGLFGIVGIGYWSRKRFFKTEQEKLEALLNDKRYQRSLETIFGESEGEKLGLAITELDEQKFLRAKRDLIGEGVNAATAEANLRKLADVVVDNSNAEIDTAFAVASDLDQQGEWDKSGEIYEQLISALPDDDERSTYAKNCLASVKAKRDGDGTGQSREPEATVTPRPS